MAQARGKSQYGEKPYQLFLPLMSNVQQREKVQYFKVIMIFKKEGLILLPLYKRMVQTRVKI